MLRYDITYLHITTGCRGCNHGTSIFPDVKETAWSSGYINEAIDKGYITGMTDGRFHPADYISYAQICTILVKALGYTDQDITGQWPQNYISKASLLGLTKGVNLKSNDKTPRWAAVTMINNLLDTEVKSSGTGTASQTFIEATGFYTKCMTVDIFYLFSNPASPYITGFHHHHPKKPVEI